MRSDSIQDLSFVRDNDRFATVTKHLNENYLRTGATSAQPDIQKEIPAAGLSGLYSLLVLLIILLLTELSVYMCVCVCVIVCGYVFAL